MSPSPDPPLSLRQQIQAERWYHTINLPDGSSTDGIFDTRATSRDLPWPTQLRAGRCLDIGTCDGFWAFEMEQRGAAEVVAIDVGHASDVDLTWEARLATNASTRMPGGTQAARRFALAHQALGSRVRRVECSVYDLDPAQHGQFDVVFLGTLLIHLQDPVRALERVRAVCTGELILVECVDARLDLLSGRVAAAQLSPAPGQWWRTNTAGLTRVLEIAGFEIMSVSRPFLTPFGPGMTGRGKAWRRPLAASMALLRRWPFLARAPGLVRLVGLLGGTYDIVMRARPKTRQLS